MVAGLTDDQRVAITEHLLADLTVDARTLWDAAPPEPTEQPLPGRGLHDAIHARLGAVTRTLRRTKSGLPLHAASCVLPDGRGVLIAGPTGSGKSTLGVMLGVEHGATLVSDDTVWLTDRRASSIGTPVALRPGSPLWAEARGLWYADGSTRLLARAIDLGVPSTQLSGSLDLLLLPTFDPARSGLRVITAAEAFCHLAGSLLRECSALELDSVARLAARLPAASLSYPDVPTSLELCTRFFEGPVEGTPGQPSRLSADEVQQAGLCRDVEGVRFGDEVVLWRSPAGQLAYVRGWAGGSLWHTPAEEALAAMGFLERKDGERVRRGFP